MIDRSIEEGLGEQDEQDDPFKFKDQACGWTPERQGIGERIEETEEGVALSTPDFLSLCKRSDIEVDGVPVVVNPFMPDEQIYCIGADNDLNFSGGLELQCNRIGSEAIRNSDALRDQCRELIKTMKENGHE